MISEYFKQKLKNCGNLKYIDWNIFMPYMDSHNLNYNESNKFIIYNGNNALLISKVPTLYNSAQDKVEISLLSVKDLKIKCNDCNNTIINFINNYIDYHHTKDISKLLTCNEFLIKNLLE